MNENISVNSIYPLVSGNSITKAAPIIGTMPNTIGGYVWLKNFKVMINGATIEPIRAIIDAKSSNKRMLIVSNVVVI